MRAKCEDKRKIYFKLNIGNIKKKKRFKCVDVCTCLINCISDDQSITSILKSFAENFTIILY